MSTKKSKMNASGGLYIALAICILSVICIGVYSAVLGLVQPITDSKLQEPNNGETPKVTVETPKPTTPTPTTPKPTTPPKPSEPTVTPETEPEQNVGATPVSPEFYLPVVGSIIKEYSNDMLVYSETMNDYRLHNGIDLSAVIGERVKAFTDGVVEDVYEDPLMGQTVLIDHGNGLKSVYQNLMPSLPDGIEVGQAVKSGQVIGGVGDSSLIECAQEPHLHFEVWVDGSPADPLTYFN